MARRYVITSLALFAALTVLLGVLYPLAVYAVGQVGFRQQAEGSLVKENGQIIGSKLIAEDFTSAKYFHPRPSKTIGTGFDGNGYDASASAASNLGPSNPKLIGNVPGVNIDGKNPYATLADPYCLPVQATDKNGNDITDKNGNPVYEKNKNGTYVCDPGTIPQRVLAYRAENGLAANIKVPVDAVTASFSGLDPAISVANARLQAPRVAKARHLGLGAVMSEISKHTQGRMLGFLGEPNVNVLELNLALDHLPSGT